MTLLENGKRLNPTVTFVTFLQYQNRVEENKDEVPVSAERMEREIEA
jgi:hypothetical protein